MVKIAAPQYLDPLLNGTLHLPTQPCSLLSILDEFMCALQLVMVLHPISLNCALHIIQQRCQTQGLGAECRLPDFSIRPKRKKDLKMSKKKETFNPLQSC